MSETPQHETVMDSDVQQLATLYAKALLGAAGSNVDQIVDELQALVKECLDRFPQLEIALASPSISQESKEAMLDRIFSGKVSKTLLNTLKVLCRRGRISALRAIQVTATEMRDEQLGRMRVQVASAQALTAAQKTQIADKLKSSFGKEAVLVEKVDPSLIGGVVLRIGDAVYDGSVSGKLQSMSHSVKAGVQRAIRNKFDSLVVPT
ncbi:MAG: ATP synthase F1 subunit delta [Pirellulales bacterium]